MECPCAGSRAERAWVLDKLAFPIDATFFDKQSRANWTVPAHQDRVLPVSETSQGIRRSRNGISYAEPRGEVLAQLLAVRIHFDPADANTGALALVPASHHAGVIPDAQVANIPLERYRPCCVAAGDVMLMRPLVLHRSSPSKGEGHRRVLHVVYATGEPGDRLKWRDSA